VFENYSSGIDIVFRVSRVSFRLYFVIIIFGVVVKKNLNLFEFLITLRKIQRCPTPTCTEMNTVHGRALMIHRPCVVRLKSIYLYIILYRLCDYNTVMLMYSFVYTYHTFVTRSIHVDVNKK